MSATRPHPADPDGLYARLGVAPSASAEEIAAAFRRKARALHPDVPGTGDTAAFVALREAYDVLASPERRGRYDRNARLAALDVAPPPDSGSARATVAGWAMPRPHLSPALWIAAVLVVGLGVFEAVLHLSGRADQGRIATSGSPAPAPLTRPGGSEAARSTNPGANGRGDGQQAIGQGAIDQRATERGAVGEVKPTSGATVPGSTGQAAPVRLAGTPNYYIVPAGSPTILWRADAERHSLTAAGQLPPFSAVQALRLFRQNGLVEVRISETSTGLIEATRLAPGGLAAARRAYCAYYAGPPPENGEILERHAAGTDSLELTNRAGQPIVLKLRDAAGALIASVYLAPGGSATISGLPAGRYRPDFAIGELWSRACNGFAAGMRAQRFMEVVPLAALSPLVIPPERTVPPQDIPDRLFEAR
jgi:curved DNA-binding protein CbpA